MATGDIVQARMVGLWHGQTTITQFLYTAQSGPGNVAPFLDRLRTGVINNFYGLVSPDISIVRLEGQRVSPRPLTFLATLAINQPGTLTGVSVPTSVAVVISKRTQFAGRKYRGRFFFPGLTATSQLNSQLTASAQTAWGLFAGFCDDLLTDSDGTVWLPVISHGYIPNTDVLSFTPITSCVVSPILRNQRRRQVGRGK